MMKLCEFYPDDEELNMSEPFCWKGSEVTGKPCTVEDQKKCIWAKPVCENCMEHRPNKPHKLKEFVCPECGKVWVLANVWPGNYWELENESN